MSGASEALGRKIGGAKDLSSVVRSMKALAASSITQYERSVESLQDYYRTVELGLSVCLRTAADRSRIAPESPRKSRGLPSGAIVFGSDQGLVGRFNEVLMEFAVRRLGALPGDGAAALPGATLRVWAVGERMRELVPHSALPSPTVLPQANSVEAITPLVNRIVVEIESARERGEVEEIYLFHNQPTGAASYRPVVKRLLPLDSGWVRDITRLPWPGKMLPEVIVGTALDSFIRGYLFVLIFQACAQSLASENASRLAAMQRAEENIGRILADLTRKFQRTRQESIDEELFEVISGYEALSAARK